LDDKLTASQLNKYLSLILLHLDRHERIFFNLVLHEVLKAHILQGRDLTHLTESINNQPHNSIEWLLLVAFSQGDEQVGGEDPCEHFLVVQVALCPYLVPYWVDDLV
jgi:hypothetical protein